MIFVLVHKMTCCWLRTFVEALNDEESWKVGVIPILEMTFKAANRR